MDSPRLSLEVVVSEPVSTIKKIVVKWEGYTCDEEGKGYQWCKGYIYNWSRKVHTELFKHYVPSDEMMRFVLTGRFESYINQEGRMRFVMIGGSSFSFDAPAWLWTDFFEVTVCYED